jgi:hypothetical protein
MIITLYAETLEVLPLGVKNMRAINEDYTVHWIVDNLPVGNLYVYMYIHRYIHICIYIYIYTLKALLLGINNILLSQGQF